MSGSTPPTGLDALLPPEMARKAEAQGLSWWGFAVRNLLPVTLGNIVGGAGLVGAVYWFVYLRPGRRE